MNNILQAAVLGFALFLASCSAFKITPEEESTREKAHKIIVASSMRDADLLEYEEVGSLECMRYANNAIGSPEESCKNEFKMTAAEKGAELVVIQGQNIRKCEYGTDDCIYIKAKGYKKMATALE